MRVVALLVVLCFTVCIADKFTDRGLPELNWLTYDQAIAASKENGKPTMVLLTKPWCGACKRLKEDLRSKLSLLQEAASAYNLVNVEDEEEDKAVPLAQLSVDGGYIPRVYFLRADGSIASEITAPGRDQYKYFYADTSSLVGQMNKLAKDGIPAAKTEL
eukprot:TRINITY_DN10000_c0_g1_i1.p1 TRINITY_DN10000_c0_g1~~TRINITY_DN10000_c0_g1_i1.p1  ORF type:complete len:160 (+),score=42.00 TRINITY_DN10000_c0_g1_i1:128-607(+)